MGVEWVCFGRGHFVPEILQKKLAPMPTTNKHMQSTILLLSIQIRENYLTTIDNLIQADEEEVARSQTVGEAPMRYLATSAQ